MHGEAAAEFQHFFLQRRIAPLLVHLQIFVKRQFIGLCQQHVAFLLQRFAFGLPFNGGLLVGQNFLFGKVG